LTQIEAIGTAPMGEIGILTAPAKGPAAIANCAGPPNDLVPAL
jgi:hypothetical protein